MALNNLVDSPFPTSGAKGGTGVNNGANTLTVNANSTINQNVSTTASPTFSNVQITNSILDTNANIILKTDPQTTPVNYWSISNAATGLGPVFGTVGTDTNINSNFQAKGTGFVAVLGNGTQAAQLRLYNTGNTGSIGIIANSAAASYDIVVPGAQGAAGTVLQNNGSGALSWVANGGAQGILQVVQTTLNSTFASTGATGFTDITGLSVTITPVSASSRILILGNVVIRGNVTQTFPLARLVRGSTAIFVGTGGTLANGSGGANSGLASTGGSISFNFVDSPASTSAQTYKIQGAAVSAIAFGDFDVNIVRSTTVIGSSSIIAIEIAS